MKRLYFYLEYDQPTFFTTLLKWYNFGDPCIHMGIVENLDDINNPQIIEMYFFARKSRYRDIDVHTKSKIKYYYMEVTEDQYKRFFDLMELDVANKTEFDFGNLFNFLLRKRDKEPKKVYCSEMVAKNLVAAGIQSFSKESPFYQIMPCHFKWLYNFIEDKEINEQLDNSKNKWSFWDRVKLFFK